MSKLIHFPVFLLVTGMLAQGSAYGAPNDPISDDGSVSMEVSSGGVKSSKPFQGLAKVTLDDLYREGVEIDSPDRKLTSAEFKRLSSLRDPADTGAESIIGADRRERLYTTYFPSRARTLITFSGGRCSGTLIGPNTVVTAGHCVHSGGSSGSWYSRTSYKIYAGANGTSTPYGFCTAKSLHSVVGWTSSGLETSDYGAIKLNCTVGNTVGWYGWTTADPTGQPTIIGGYPGDKPLEQWISSDKVRAITTDQIFYSNDTVGGVSGSGVWWDNNGAILIGVHAYGLHGSSPHSIYNHGKRVTLGVSNNFAFWKSLP